MTLRVALPWPRPNKESAMKNLRLALSSVFGLALCAAMSRLDLIVSAMDEVGRAFCKCG